MKKLKTILLLLLTIIIIISCDGVDSKDDIISEILKTEIRHIKRYNKLEKISKDTLTMNYIKKVKDTLKSEALMTKGLLTGNSGIMFGNLKDSKNLIEEYIKLCKNK